jgi:hypothetical protein
LDFWINEDDLETDEECLVRNCPALVVGTNCEITSPRDPVYNCLAWALGIKWGWASPEKGVAGYFWLPGVDPEWNVGAIKQLFYKVGYIEETDDRTLESGYEKVAFYLEEDGSPLHFAKQLADGRWTSKLGRIHDIAHDTLECLVGGHDGYGTIGPILKRRVSVSLDPVAPP